MSLPPDEGKPPDRVAKALLPRELLEPLHDPLLDRLGLDKRGTICFSAR